MSSQPPSSNNDDAGSTTVANPPSADQQMDDVTTTPASAAPQYYIGVDGEEFIKRTLSTLDPKRAIDQFHEQLGSLDKYTNVSPAIPQVFELTDLLGIQRNHLFEGLLSHMIEALTKHIETPAFAANAQKPVAQAQAQLQQQKQGADQQSAATTMSEALLEQTFPYIGISELHTIPVAIMEKMNNIPERFLKELKSTPEILESIPISIKRQVWEVDSEVYRKHVYV